MGNDSMNRSFLTEEAKTDINKLLDSNGASGGKFIIYQTSGNTVDKTKDEIINAVNSGKDVILVVRGDGGGSSANVHYCPLSTCSRSFVGNEYVPTGDITFINVPLQFIDIFNPTAGETITQQENKITIINWLLDLNTMQLTYKILLTK